MLNNLVNICAYQTFDTHEVHNLFAWYLSEFSENDFVVHNFDVRHVSLADTARDAGHAENSTGRHHLCNVKVARFYWLPLYWLQIAL